MSNTYEQLRDAATGEGGEAWRAADREEGKLHAFYRELKRTRATRTSTRPRPPGAATRPRKTR